MCGFESGCYSFAGYIAWIFFEGRYSLKYGYYSRKYGITTNYLPIDATLSQRTLPKLLCS